ncbi:MAG: (2Fe-2S)-binding protein [Myxococcales bacterium]|nr:(2Fe-2S)-binding protein [Myxococcales bacterium]
MATTLYVNGAHHQVDADPETPLLWVLRDHLGLTGTKYGCGVAQCGACTVHVDGSPRRSCVTPLRRVEGAAVTTIEGAEGRIAEALRAAWIDLQVPQCGFCQAGQLMSAVALLKAVPKPDDADIDRGMNGNLCRCATYTRIRAAIHQAARAVK